MPLPERVITVAATVEPEVEAAWNAWYTDVHLPEIVNCPGFRRAARYVSEGDGARTYLAVYEIDGSDVMATEPFNARRGWAEFAGRVSSTLTVYRRIAAADHVDEGG